MSASLSSENVFLSTSSARRTTTLKEVDWIQLGISIHVLREEDDQTVLPVWIESANFYPRPPRGGRRHRVFSIAFRDQHFYPRPPRGGRPGPASISASIPENFYPRPPRGGRPRDCGAVSSGCGISIHVLREEDDLPGAGRWTLYQNFYPRPPRGGRRAYACCTPAPSVFLSTSSARRTTQPACCRRAVCRISIHVLREEDDPRSGLPPDRQRRISIHVLREEDDVSIAPPRCSWGISIHVLREEDDRLRHDVAAVACDISIHVLREEDD